MKLQNTDTTRNKPVYSPKITTASLAGLLTLCMASVSLGNEHREADDDEIEYSKALILLQLNDTDGDLGFHARIDGEPWDQLFMDNPDEKRIFALKPRRQLKNQGMTEVSFESHEPPFDELSPDAFFERFPEGEYEISGRTLGGETLESDVMLSHVIPAPASNIAAGGTSIEFDCEDDMPPVIARPYTISWDPVTSSHPTIGPVAEMNVMGYELVVERIDGTPLKFQVNLDADVTAFTVPSDLVGQGDTLKVEVLVIAENGNETGREACFMSAE